MRVHRKMRTPGTLAVAIGAILAAAALAEHPRFREPQSSPEAAGDGAFSVAAADLDGDGDQDLAVGNQLSDNVTILENR